MSTASALVKAHLEEDLILRNALARGIVNYQAAAEWLVDTFSWDATPESVATALRRSRSEIASDPTKPAVEVLHRSHVNSRSDMSTIQFSNDPTVRRRLPELFDAVDYTRGETLRVISSPGGFKVILDGRNLSSATEIMGTHAIEAIRQNLSELSVDIPQDSWETPGLLAAISGRLANRGINVASVVDGVYEDIFLVEEEDAYEAFRSLKRLTSPSDPARAAVEASP